MDQPTPVWSVPNDRTAQQLHPSSQTATTTILTTPQQQQQPPSITLYDQQHQYSVRAFMGSTLVVDKNSTTTYQLQRWAILIDTGAIT
eukprot:3519006-Amphidinium_carterae.1